MACNCKVLKNKFEKLQSKYIALRKDYKKLLGVAVILTDALEEFIKQGVNKDLINTLESCSALYPDLFRKSKCMEISSNFNKKHADPNADRILDENGKIYEPSTESEKEYYEGFLARPKIPRTPQG